MQSGYPLYSLDKIITQLLRFAQNVLNSEGKEKSFDIYPTFKRDRVKDATTAQQQTNYRKSVEKMLKDGDLYRIDHVSSVTLIAKTQHQLTILQDQEQRHIRFYLTKKDDPTFDDSLSTADKEHY